MLFQCKETLPSFCLLFLLYFYHNSFAQIGHGLQAGLSFSSFSNDTLKSKGGRGVDFQYFAFAKYSSKLEWNAGFGFTTVKREEIPVINIKQSSLGNVDYTISNINANLYLLSLRYSLTYYVLPDKVGIIGGLELGTGALSSIQKSFNASTVGLSSNEFLLQSIDTNALTNLNPTNALKTEDIDFNGFFWAPTVGISYTYDMRYSITARYHFYRNTYFGNDFGGPLPDASRLNLLLVTLGYKFLPSPKKARF